MPSVALSHINIALNSFGLCVVLIILAACFNELVRQKSGSRYFLVLLSLIVFTLVADIFAWIGEGNVQLRMMTLIANTVASCVTRIAIICFMGYLKESLYANSRAAAFTLTLFRILCVISLIVTVGDAFFGYFHIVNEHGHYILNPESNIRLLSLLFPLLAFVAIILMALFATQSARVSRFVFIVYTIFPIAGFIIDHIFHGYCFAYIGLVVSVLIIYTNIYLQKQKQIDAQRNALMISQINPHFIYNTLSTIASMCDISPSQAKNLTVDFSKYLRQNLGTMTKEGLIPFEQEMEHVECYLKIEKVRFRERLNINYAIRCSDFLVPPLTVQPLVENAVKHGITKKAEGGMLKISTYENGENYVIEIIDDGVGFEAETTEMHVGIQNVSRRIASMCKGVVSLKSMPTVGTRVTIEIPKKINKKGSRYEHSGS